MKISSETGHVYGITNLKEERYFEFEMSLGDKIESFLGESGNETIRVFLHDDVSEKKIQAKSLDSWRWEYALGIFRQRIESRLSKMNNSFSFRVDEIIQHESDLIHEGINQVVQKIEEKAGDEYNQESGKVRIDGEKIKVFGYKLDKSIPSCEVLDVAFYLKRLYISNPTVTIIHESMKGQQNRVKKILKLINIKKLEIIILFHNGDEITECEYWGDGDNAQIAEKLSDKFLTT